MMYDDHNLTKAEVCLYLLSPDIADIVGSATDCLYRSRQPITTLFRIGYPSGTQSKLPSRRRVKHDTTRIHELVRYRINLAVSCFQMFYFVIFIISFNT